MARPDDEDEGPRERGVRPGWPGGVVDLDVSWLVPADLSAVDALARLQMVAARRGYWLRLHGADGGLVELLEFVGLGDVVHLCSATGVRGAARRPLSSQVVREAEQLEQ